MPFTDLAFIEKFEKSQAHQFARDYLSPDCFTHVCVRRGKIRARDGQIFLEVTRSVMLQYGKDGNFKRDVHISEERNA